MHKKAVLKLASGFRGRAGNCIRIARERVEKALQYATRDRRAKKRDVRGLWIARINAGAREYGVRSKIVFLPFSVSSFRFDFGCCWFIIDVSACVRAWKAKKIAKERRKRERKASGNKKSDERRLENSTFSLSLQKNSKTLNSSTTPPSSPG